MLCAGVRQSAGVNAFLVVVKVAVIVVVIAVGARRDRSGQLEAVRAAARGRVRVRLARHRARRVDPVLRLPRVRDGLDGRLGVAQSAARHADRHPRRAGRLHGALPRGRRRADRRRALSRARRRGSRRARGRPDGPAGRRGLRQGRRADGPRVGAARQCLWPVAHHIPDVARRHAAGALQPRARAVPHAASRDHRARRRLRGLRRVLPDRDARGPREPRRGPRIRDRLLLHDVAALAAARPAAAVSRAARRVPDRARLDRLHPGDGARAVHRHDPAGADRHRLAGGRRASR